MKALSFNKMICVVLAICVAGCKETLYSSLSELEANEMVSVLAAADVESKRVRGKDGVYELQVHGDDIAIATVLLKAAGLPKQKFQSLGDVFSSSGIIGTPFEQQARYIFAMNQELSRTTSEIDGVESARVIVNAPLVDRYNRNSTSSTASVTIHYEAGFDTQSSIIKIKQIVAHSVPNLDYDDVSVVFFPANSLQIEVPTETEETPVNSAAILGQSGTAQMSIRQVILLLLAISIPIAVMLNWSARTNHHARRTREDLRAHADLTGRQ